MIVEDLVARIGLDFTGARSAAAAVNAISSIKDITLGVGGVLLAAQAAFGGVTLSVTENVAQLTDFGVAVGASVQNLQTLTYAAELSGGSFEDVSRGLRILTDNAGSAAHGNETAAASFARLGVSVHNANGTLKTADQLSGDVAEGLSKIQDPTARLNAAQDLLGKGAVKLLPAFQGGAEGLAAFRKEAERLGVVMDQTTIERFQRMDDALDALGARAKGIKNQIGKAFLPFLEKSVASISAFLDKNADKVSNFIEHAANLVGRPIALLAQLGGMLASFVGSLDGATGALAKMSLGLLAFAAVLALPGGAILILSFLIAAIAEDIYRFLNGQSSALGKAVAGWKEFNINLIEVANTAEGLLGVLAKLSNVIIGFGRVGAGTLSGNMHEAVNGARQIVSAKQISEAQFRQSDFENGPMNGQLPLAPLSSAVPSGSPLMNQTPLNGAQRGYLAAPPNITNTITVTVPPGTGADEAKKMITEALDRHMEFTIEEVRSSVGSR